jgi:hypothetical protein
MKLGVWVARHEWRQCPKGYSTISPTLGDWAIQSLNTFRKLNARETLNLMLPGVSGGEIVLSSKICKICELGWWKSPLGWERGIGEVKGGSVSEKRSERTVLTNPFAVIYSIFTDRSIRTNIRSIRPTRSIRTKVWSLRLPPWDWAWFQWRIGLNFDREI